MGYVDSPEKMFWKEITVLKSDLFALFVLVRGLCVRFPLRFLPCRPVFLFLNLSPSKKNLGHFFYSLFFAPQPPWPFSFLVHMSSAVTTPASSGTSLTILQTDS